MSILVLGTAALDTVRTPHGLRDNMLGGSAVHFSLSARFFTDVNLVAIVGEDFPQKNIALLRKNKINLTSLIKTPGKTFRWSGEYKEGDLNTALTLSTELGVLSSFKPVLPREQRKIKYIFLANVDPNIQLHLLNHMHKPTLTGCDSMNFWITHQKKDLLKLLRKVDIYVANDAEARALSGCANLVEAGKSLRALGPKMVVIKKGEHGVLFLKDKMIFSLPGYPVEKVIDPTGAGDTFAGAFMGYLAKAQRTNPDSIRHALVYGTILASFNVEGFGPERIIGLTQKQIQGRFNEFRRIVNF